MTSFKLKTSLIWPAVVLIIVFGAFWLKPWQTRTPQTISVTAQGMTEAVPSIVKISGNVQSSGVSAEVAQSANQEKADNLINALKAAGIETQKIQTTSISVNPQYDYQRRPPQIINFQANTTISVETENITLANQIPTLLTQNGATSIFGPNLEIDESRLEEAKSQAREDAISKAKAKASQLAGLSDRKLGKVVSISEEDGFRIPQPIPLAVGSAELDEQIAQIEPGQKEVTINLKIDFELK